VGAGGLEKRNENPATWGNDNKDTEKKENKD